MSSANRLRLSYTTESTAGVTPNTPRMKEARITGESLSFAPTYTNSDELRADRMTSDPIQVLQAAQGGINFEMSFPADGTFLSDAIRSELWNDWTKSPVFDNDGTADSVITDAGTVADTYAVASGGASVVAGHLVLASGFTNAANGGSTAATVKVFRVASSTATTIVGTSLGLVAETAPPGTARLKVVGFQGASGDIVAAADGLTSTALDFTTLGIIPGQALKVGGTATGNRFATAAINGRGRAVSVTAHKITMDNLPTGWTTDSGSGKTIMVWFGDNNKNGITPFPLTLEKGFMDQTVPSYIVTRGNHASRMTFSITAGRPITGSIEFLGMSGGASTTSLDSAPDAATINPVLAGSVNVGRMYEAGVAVSAPTFITEFSIDINNNLRGISDITSASYEGITPGECTVTGQLSTYFADLSIQNKLFNNTPSSNMIWLEKAYSAIGTQAVVWQLPRYVLTGGVPAASGKNTDVILQSSYTASKDPTTSAVVICDRFYYLEL